jgi:hypothetical protein
MEGKVRDGEGMIQDGEAAVEAEGRVHDDEVKEGAEAEGMAHGVEGDRGPANLQEGARDHHPRAGARSE